MNSTVVTAMAAALGSLLGAAASIATTWITQRTQTIRAHSEWTLRERESLYREFITEASRLTVDALAHCLERPDQLMALYGILSRIRLMSGEEVVRQGEACCRRIIELYGRPNLTTDQIRAVAEGHDLDGMDPLKEFSTACRKELLARHW
ncbi:MAG: hypothetical protein ABSG68_00770 [Thermoguttaceae bacterium]